MEPARVRVFVALDPAPDTRAALVRLKTDFAATGADVRWVRDAGLHCTLKFLGAVGSDRLDAVRAALESALAGVAPFPVHARGVGVFPGPSRPRVVWAGFAGAGVSNVARIVAAVLANLGFAPEKRPFTGHITFGRVRSTKGWQRLEKLLRDHAAEDFGATQVDRVVAYRSELRPGGSVYTPLWTIPLGNSSFLCGQ